MDETALRTFLSLCDTENTRDTAAELGIDQSTVSRTLGRIEADLGVPLFNRRGRRLLLNSRGAGFRADTTRILEAIESARRHAATGDGDEVVRLGFVPSVGRWMLPGVVRAYREARPAVRFELRADFARELFRLIRDDIIDAALVTAPRTGEPDLDWHLLRDERLCVAVPSEHRFARRRRLEVSELAREPFIAFTHATELRGVVDAMLQRNGVQVTVAFESGELDTMRGLVAAGLGVAIMPEGAASDREPVYVPLVPHTTRPLGVAWREPGRRSQAAAEFLEHVRGG